MTKYEMVLKISAQTGVDQTQTKLIVQMALDGITDILARNGRLELRDFGVFEVRRRNARMGRNPKTGVVVAVPSKRTVSFKAGKLMTQRVGSTE